MKAIVKPRPEPGAEVQEVKTPVPGAGEVLVRVEATSICGTDLHIYQWDTWSQGRIKPPLVFGHEMVGRVVECGKEVKTLKVGDYVSAETHITCGHCYMCRTGNAHICLNVQILGVDRPGTFAEYVALPEQNAWKTDPSIPPEIACLQEPFGNAVHATLIEDISGKTVAVFGCGPIGLMSISVARACGASRIFAVEPDSYRLSLAGPAGATHSIDPARHDPVEFILDETNGLGVDVFLEMSGAERAIDQGLRALRKGGRVSFLGITKGRISLDLNDGIVFKGAVLYGINGRIMFDTWYRATELLLSGKVDLKPFVTHRMQFEQVHEAMELLSRRKACKIVLTPPGISASSPVE